MDSADVLILQFEVLAISARVRRLGHPETADLVEAWATSTDFVDQVRSCPPNGSPPGGV